MNGPLIAVDVGNTTIQFGLFAPSDEVAATHLPAPRHVNVSPADQSLDVLRDWLPDQPCRWSIASVNRAQLERLEQWIERNRVEDRYRRLAHDEVPLRIRVDRPEQVGMDRLMAAVAADRLRRPDRAAVIVDAGSAITVDLLSATGEFEGGMILAGFQMAARALAQGTDLLPLVGFSPHEELPELIGKSTIGAIRSGLFWGNVGSIRFLIERIAGSIGHSPDLFVTGGDARWIPRLLRSETPDSESPAGTVTNTSGNSNGPVAEARFESHLVLSGIRLTDLRSPEE